MPGGHMAMEGPQGRAATPARTFPTGPMVMGHVLGAVLSLSFHEKEAMCSTKARPAKEAIRTSSGGKALGGTWGRLRGKPGPFLGREAIVLPVRSNMQGTGDPGSKSRPVRA